MQPVRVQLEINPGSDPISGEIADRAGSRRFQGWLELTEAIETARAGVSAEPREAVESIPAEEE